MRRHSTGLAAAILAALLTTVGSTSVSAQTSSPLTPSGLSEVQAHTTKPISAGGWINQTALDLQFSVQVTAGNLTPQVEVETASTPFTGTPNFSAPALATSSNATVHVTGLKNRETYHWQARVQDSAGNVSPWSLFSSASAASDFGIDQDGPVRPVIRSSTNPDPNRWYNVRTVSVAWSARDTLSGVQGYSFALLRHAHVIAPGSTTSRTGARISNLGDGVWFLAIRAVDRAGNWSPTATYRLALDRSSTRITWLSPNRQQFNPLQGTLTVRFKVNKQSHGAIALYRVGASRPVTTYTFASLRPGQVASITWSGKGVHGNPLQHGYYFFSARLSDIADNITQTNLGGVELSAIRATRAATGEQLYPDGGKRIIVSLSRETLYAYDGTKLVQQTYVTTGNPNLPTPPGVYHVMAKYHPFQFVSPWPPGSPYWYAPSWSQYAMLFREGGYFLHDAPWRSAFGPGTNRAGQPGTNYGGTHGCVNIPPSPMLFLWNWTSVGTLVEVVQ